MREKLISGEHSNTLAMRTKNEEENRFVRAYWWDSDDIGMKACPVSYGAVVKCN